MKTFNIKSSLMLLAAAALASCNSFLDELPDNRMELSSKQDVAKLLISAYPTQSGVYLLETMSDNTDENISSSWTSADRLQEEMFNWEDITQVDDESPQEIWNAHYSAIAAANQALEYTEALNPEQQKEYLTEMSEAYLCRAFAMFKLSEVFCHAYDPAHADTDLGLPYPTKPEKVIGESYERGTLADLYKQIDADIQKAMPNLTNVFGAPKYHFNQNAAYAFACRFYLNYRQYDKAIEYATKVLGDNPAAKLRDWAEFDQLDMNKQIRPNDYVDSKKNCNLMLVSYMSQWGAHVGPYSYAQRYVHNAYISQNETLESMGLWGKTSSTLGWNLWSNSSLAAHFAHHIPYAFEYTDVQAGIGNAHCVLAEFTTDRLLMERAEAYGLRYGETHNEADLQACINDMNTELSAFQLSGSTKLTLSNIKNFYGGIEYYTPELPTVKKEFHSDLVTDMENQEPVMQCFMHLNRILTMHEGERMQYVKRYGITIHRRSVSAAHKLLEVKDTMAARDNRLAVQLPADVISAGMVKNPR